MVQEKSMVAVGWHFDNSYARLPEAFFIRQNPAPVPSPKLTILNEPLAEALGLNVQALRSEDGVAILAGNRVPEGALPLAQAYAGHQFGYRTMLGDGRALLIGEQITPMGERFDIQLKGSGKTPFSRQGDGRAALGPMLREYLISEAMHSLGIPTSRSLAVVTTGETIHRETDRAGAVLTRVAASHLRVGTFQYASMRGEVEELRSLADYALHRHFPEHAADENPYRSLLEEVVKGQAGLIAKWQMVGFIHGVMNTDNMTISGETIDYGPCAFMDEYDPETVFSSIDLQGRYAYGNQPKIAAWNLVRFAETLLPLLHDDQAEAIGLAQEAISEFPRRYHARWLSGMRAKLGMFGQESEDEDLIEGLLQMMRTHHADYTNTFRALTLNISEETSLFGSPEFLKWHALWQARLGRQPESAASVHQLMQKTNPAIIPRNHRVEAALDAAVEQGDGRLLQKLLDVLAKPYAYAPEQAEFTQLPPQSDRPYRTYCGT